MVRIILEDIKFNKKKNIVSPKIEKPFIVEPTVKTSSNNEEKIKDSKIEEYFKSKPTERQRIQRTPQLRVKNSGFNKYILFFFVLSLVAGFIYWGGIMFQKVDITITSKHQPIVYNNKQFISVKDSSESTDNFMVMIYSDKKSKNITLTEPKEVSIKSEGSIVLYNEFSTNPQKLLAGTFIADNDGKTYKTNSIVTIPGYKMDNKKLIPGQVVTNISSFLPGDAYNGSPADFFITSFKGTPKYNKIYGKLKSPLVGGASGLMYTPTDLDLRTIENMAQTSFKDDLIKKVEASIYPGYILYPNAVTFSYKIEDGIFSKTPEAEIIVEGVLSVVLLKEKSLMDNIKKISLPKISESELREIKILDIDKLSFNFTNKDQLITKDLNSISFNLSGDLDAVWYPDIEILKTKLLGVNKSDVLSIFKQDPGISAALVKIFPPWQKYIPKDLSKINIILK